MNKRAPFSPEEIRRILPETESGRGMAAYARAFSAILSRPCSVSDAQRARAEAVRAGGGVPELDGWLNAPSSDSADGDALLFWVLNGTFPKETA
jgi:hypothetical protein